MEGPLRTAGPPYPTVGSTVSMGSSVAVGGSSVALGWGVSEGTSAVLVFCISSSDSLAADVASSTWVGPNNAVIVLSGVGNEKGVGVENPGKVQAVRPKSIDTATIK